MRKLSLGIGLIAILVFIAGFATAKNAKLYVSTYATSHTHTGMKVTLSGLFNQYPETDTSWNFLGRPNNYVSNFDIFNPSNGKIIAMATHTGVHQSWDGGKSWKETSDWKMTEVNNVRFDRTNSDIVYASTPYGFYKSVNGGHKWQQKNNGIEGPDATYITSFVVSHKNPSIIFIATEDGVYKSEDAGESWIKTSLRIKNIKYIEQHPQNADIFIAATEHNGLYFTFNSGKHWEKRENGIVHSSFYCVAFDPDNPDVIYAGGFSTGIYQSLDGGDSWNFSFKGLECLDISSISVDPANSNIVYVGTLKKGVFQSIDKGLTWEYLGIKSGIISSVKAVISGEDNE